MKTKTGSFLIVMALIAMLISACGAVSSETSTGGDKPRASLVEFTGIIEAINGNQWTINGQTITVDPSILRDGPYIVGDTVKVEVEVQNDGSVVVTRVEAPSAAPAPIGSDDSANANANDNNSNDDSISQTGVIESITGDQWTIGGQVYTVTPDMLDDDSFVIGDTVELDFRVADDGSLVLRRVKFSDDSNDNSNDDNSNDDNGNDDNGNDDNSNDDNGNDDNSNDDDNNDNDQSGKGSGNDDNDDDDDNDNDD